MRYLTLNEVLTLHSQVMGQSGGAVGIDLWWKTKVGYSGDQFDMNVAQFLFKVEVFVFIPPHFDYLSIAVDWNLESRPSGTFPCPQCSTTQSCFGIRDVGIASSLTCFFECAPLVPSAIKMESLPTPFDLAMISLLTLAPATQRDLQSDPNHALC